MEPRTNVELREALSAPKKVDPARGTGIGEKHLDFFNQGLHLCCSCEEVAEHK